MCSGSFSIYSLRGRRRSSTNTNAKSSSVARIRARETRRASSTAWDSWNRTHVDSRSPARDWRRRLENATRLRPTSALVAPALAHATFSRFNLPERGPVACFENLLNGRATAQPIDLPWTPLKLAMSRSSVRAGSSAPYCSLSNEKLRVIGIPRPEYFASFQPWLSSRSCIPRVRRAALLLS
jgi:hypothetical protein